jgi:hypothetical protein
MRASLTHFLVSDQSYYLIPEFVVDFPRIMQLPFSNQSLSEKPTENQKSSILIKLRCLGAECGQ